MGLLSKNHKTTRHIKICSVFCFTQNEVEKQKKKKKRIPIYFELVDAVADVAVPPRAHLAQVQE
jgi:hypothetical protein